jgi:hypothetical protein
MALTQINSNSITDGSIQNADISSSASIDASKITGLSTDSITNGTSNVSVAASGDITVTRAGSTKATFNSAGADIPGTLTVNKLVVDDDGQGGAVCSIRSDDGTPWAFVVGNDTYSSNENDGLRIYQADNGDVFLDIKGASNYEDFNIRANNGTTAQNCLRITSNREVTLHYQGAQKLATTSTGIDVTGTVQCDGLTCEGGASITVSNGRLDLKDSNDTGNAALSYVRGLDSGNTQQWYVGNTNSGADIYLNNDQTGGWIVFATESTNRAWFTNAGHFQPAANNAYDLGSPSAQWRNAYFDGTVTCDGLTSDGAINCASAIGQVNIQDTNNTGTACQAEINFKESDGTTQGYLGYANTSNSTFYIANVESNAGITFITGNVLRASLQGDGHFVPWTNNTYDLGTSSLRWRNIYTNDLNLSNEGGSNDVDGTWGSWTIQEGEDDLFLLNRRNGKKYKFNLTEIN